MRNIKQKTVNYNYININKFVQLYIGNSGDLCVLKVFYIGLEMNKK